MIRSTRYLLKKHISWSTAENFISLLVFNFTSPSSPHNLILKCNKKPEAEHNFFKLSVDSRLSIHLHLCSALYWLFSCWSNHQHRVIIISFLNEYLNICHAHQPRKELDSIERVYIFPRIWSLSPYHKLSSQMFQRLSKIFSLLLYCAHIEKRRNNKKNSPFSCFWLFGIGREKTIN